ncbi:hypothetical protein PoB_000823700 [Plakobranchus ocellatus]|uniref:Uncharacterized protein n=1 Tax=Plakobranchus ocellatus TaxID=259542 RepID=A0AAV3YH20_9GAST|nr:hypothetical protein PoB_000823700 [Plakobranchus ocellatus]
MITCITKIDAGFLLHSAISLNVSTHLVRRRKQRIRRTPSTKNVCTACLDRRVHVKTALATGVSRLPREDTACSCCALVERRSTGRGGEGQSYKSWQTLCV